MKHIYTLLFLAFALSSIGQIVDRTETDCEGESRSIYATGDMGLPLLVASKGFDCSICQNQAGTVRDFADENEGTVAVWAAMFNLYSSATPTCSNVSSWDATYDWGESIFSFLDLDEYWVESGAPRYYVIHPTTREIIYEGSSFSTASTTALEVSTLSTQDDFENGALKVYQGDRGIILEKPFELSGELRIFNIVGQEVFASTVPMDSERLTLDFNLNDGIYIASLYSEGNRLSTKFVFKR